MAMKLDKLKCLEAVVYYDSTNTQMIGTKRTDLVQHFITSNYEVYPKNCN